MFLKYIEAMLVRKRAYRNYKLSLHTVFDNVVQSFTFASLRGTNVIRTVITSMFMAVFAFHQ